MRVLGGFPPGITAPHRMAVHQGRQPAPKYTKIIKTTFIRTFKQKQHVRACSQAEISQNNAQ
jgi:hypothetical protein